MDEVVDFLLGHEGADDDGRGAGVDKDDGG